MGNDRRTRITRNVITGVVIIALGVAMAFTTGLVGSRADNMGMPGGQSSQQQMMPPGDNNSSDTNGDSNSNSSDSSNQNGQQQQPPGDNNSSDTNGDSNSNSSNSNNQNGQPPEPPDGQQPPDMNGQQPPDMNGQQPPDMNGQQPPDMNGQQPPDMNGQQPAGMNDGMRAGMKVLTGAEGLAMALLIMYLIMSRGNRKTFKETLPDKKKIATLVIATVLAGGALTTTGILIPEATGGSDMQGPPQQGQQMQDNQDGQQGQPGQNESNVEATGTTTVDGKEQTLNGIYESTNADENVILVTNGGTLISDGATLNKSSGDGSNTDSCDFHGVNAGLLVNESSTAKVTNATIKTAATLSNGVFCTGENSKIEISDSTITTTGERSCRGLDATNGGTIIADNMKVTTQGGSCATLATDRGEGTVTVTNSKLETNGAGSPVIYSTGDISIDNTTGTANGAQITVVEGKNKATVTNSEVTASGTGNRGDVDACGVMLYQSMSGDADEGTATFTAKNSTLSIDKESEYYKKVPMFFVTNTDSVIKLTNTKLNFGSGILLSVKGTSEWGNEGSNGGTVKLVASNQTLKGDIEADDISTIAISLKNGSTLTGSINADNDAKSISLKISKDSKVTLSADTYVSSLDDEDSTYNNIDFNGYKLYVDGTAIK